MTTRARLLAGCLAGSLALPIHAQTGNGTTGDVDEIIVTGARAPVSISEVGSATTVFTRDDIERRQVRYVTDLLREVPGFSISSSGGAGTQTQVRVRGTEANHVLVLIDGVRANDPASGDEFRWEQLSTANVERIEIVRGPQSSLWGSDAVAGVVHVITNDGRRGGALDSYVETGSFGTTNFGASARIGGEQFMLSGGIERLDTDGTNVSRDGDEEDGADLTTATLGAHFDATDSLAFDLSLRAVDAYTEFDTTDFSTGLPGDSDSATESENQLAALTVILGRPGDRIVHRLSGRYFNSDQRSLAGGSENSSTQSDRLTFAWQADIAMGDNGVSLAVEHEQTDFSQRGEVNFGDPNQDQSIDATSLVAEYRYLAGNRLSWLLSGRFDSNSDFDDSLTGRLALAYQLAPATALKGNIGTAQKNPTFIERFGFFPAQFLGNPDLEPEESLSVDLGLVHEFDGPAVTVEAWLFRQQLDNEINGFVFDPDTSQFTAENESGTSDRNGLEFVARWRMTDRFGMHATYTYTDATEEGADGEDIREIRRPRHAGSVSLDYRSDSERLQLALTADYGGTRLDTFFPPFPEPPATVTLDSFWLVELTAQFRLTPSVSLYARGTNLLDEEYEQVFGYNTPGRAGYVGIRADFGR